jgi:hypothetical protein
MKASELTEKLIDWVSNTQPVQTEKELHAKVLETLKDWGMCVEDKAPIRNPRLGKSRIDLRVTNVDPQLLIELKKGGDWHYVSNAAWQLYQASKLLQDKDVATSMLAIFGSRPI